MTRIDPPTTDPEKSSAQSRLHHALDVRVTDAIHDQRLSLLAAVAVSAILVWAGADSGLGAAALGGAGGALIGGVVAVVLLAAILLLPSPFGLAVAVVTSGAVLASTPLLVQVGVAVLLITAGVVDATEGGRSRGFTVLLVGVLLGGAALISRPIVTGDGVGWAATVLVVGTATLMYALHRYALVRTGEVTDGD